VNVVPRFFPFFVATPVTPALESSRGGVSETLNPSSAGAELLIPFLGTTVLSTGIATGTVGARVTVEETSSPGGDTDEDMDNDARELRVVVALCNVAGLGTDVSTERMEIQSISLTMDDLRRRVHR
jgi:hypothetical protein